MRARAGTPAALPALAALAALTASGAVLAMEFAGGRAGLIPAGWHGLPGWMRGPLPAIGHGIDSHRYGVLFLAMCALYLLVLVLHRRLPAGPTVGAIVVLHLAFLLAPPVLSADVFGYIDWARIGAVHGLDPYTHGSLSAVQDPVYAFMRWRTHMGSPYGPLFTVASYVLAPLSVPASLWVLKAVAALSSLAIVALSWAGARRLGRAPVPAAALVGLNPLVLVWALGGAHNDLLATAIAMGAVYLALGARERAAGAVSLIAIAVKASTAVVFPFLIAGSRRRREALAGAALALAFTVVVAVAAFGRHAAGFVASNRDQQRLVAANSLPNKVSSWLGFHGLPGGVRAAAVAVLVVSVVWLLVRTWRGGDWVTAAGWATLALLATSAWLMPWYVIWVLPLAALAGAPQAHARVARVLRVHRCRTHPPLGFRAWPRTGCPSSSGRRWPRSARASRSSPPGAPTVTRAGSWPRPCPPSARRRRRCSSRSPTPPAATPR